jgi:hypothetical protein
MVGFIVLLLLGITLAIYSARYIPTAVSKLSNGLTTSSSTPAALTVVSASSTASSLPFSNGAGDLMVASTTTVTVPPTGTGASTNAASAPSSASASKTVAPYGLPDLAVTIIATGYLSGDSTDTFVPATIIPPGARPAVKFSIADDGTNVTGPWTFLANIPTLNHYTFNSPEEASMGPGDHVVFTLGFNQALPGNAQTITVVADPNNQIQESSKENNVASAAVTITATGN